MTQSLHPAAQHGFSASAELYTAVRPDYPESLALWLQQRLHLHDQQHFLDLGAGTD